MQRSSSNHMQHGSSNLHMQHGSSNGHAGENRVLSSSSNGEYCHDCEKGPADKVSEAEQWQIASAVFDLDAGKMCDFDLPRHMHSGSSKSRVLGGSANHTKHGLSNSHVHSASSNHMHGGPSNQIHGGSANHMQHSSSNLQRHGHMHSGSQNGHIVGGSANSMYSSLSDQHLHGGDQGLVYHPRCSTSADPQWP